MAEHCASSTDWSDLPSDLLGRILQLLEVPEALAVAAVCASWRSAAAAAGAGDPRGPTPWLMSSKLTRRSRPSSHFINLLGTHKTYEVGLPEGRSHLDWCGASHGWLLASDELSNLVLCHPFTSDTIPLPPITDLECVKAVHHGDGNIVSYRYGKYHEHEPTLRGLQHLGAWFYQKVVWSGDPSHGGDYDTAVTIHYDANSLSFARAREGRWRLAGILGEDSNHDQYADCVYHDGRFYTVTLRGVVESWDLRGPREPRKEVIITDGDRRYCRVLTRFLVSTPCGRLLQIRTLRRISRPREIKVQVLQVYVDERKLVSLSPSTALSEHAVFVGLNHSACLPTKEFPGLRSNCVYYSAPRLVHGANFGLHGSRGVRIYDLENQTSEHVLSSYGDSWPPTEMWYIPGF